MPLAAGACSSDCGNCKQTTPRSRERIDAIRSDILEARWSAYAIETKDGRSLSGLIQSETSDAIVFAMMGGVKETLPRSAIKEMKSLDRTLMPVGLEAAITKEQMGDLIAFLLGK